MSDAVMHVGIENPVERRKEVLSVGIDTIQALKNFEMHKKTQKEKNMHKRNFAQLIKEIKTLLEEFRMSLPEVHAPPHKKVEKQAGQPKKEVPKPVITIQRTQMAKLEDDIGALRRKIAEL